jgi:hypothetical protein
MNQGAFTGRVSLWSISLLVEGGAWRGRCRHRCRVSRNERVEGVPNPNGKYQMRTEGNLFIAINVIQAQPVKVAMVGLSKYRKLLPSGPWGIMYLSHESDLGGAATAIVGIHAELYGTRARLTGETERLLTARAADNVEGEGWRRPGRMGDATGLRRDLNRGRAHPEVCGGVWGFVE